MQRACIASVFMVMGYGDILQGALFNAQMTRIPADFSTNSSIAAKERMSFAVSIERTVDGCWFMYASFKPFCIFYPLPQFKSPYPRSALPNERLWPSTKV